MREDYHLVPLEETKAAIAEEQNNQPPRFHLGCSEIGGDCRADLWHKFRWNTSREFDAETHLRFMDGHRSEDVMADYLRKGGVKLQTVDPETNKQFRVQALGGHFAGSMDGIIVGGGMPWHRKQNESSIWEHKAVNDKKFRDLQKLDQKCSKEALENWDSVYYGQAQAYMAMTGINTHWLTCSTAGCRDFYAVLTHADPAYGRAMLAKAESVITAQSAPAKEFKSGEFFKAKFLDSYDILYRGAIPAPTFRNSMFSYPVTDDDRTDGAWYDEFLGREVTQYEQKNTPKHHLWIPSMVPFAECVSLENSLKPRWAEYRLPDGKAFYNCQFGMEGPNAYNSDEMRLLTPEIIHDDKMQELRKYGARLEAIK